MMVMIVGNDIWAYTAPSKTERNEPILAPRGR